MDRLVGCRILIVEDEVLIALELQSLLTDEGVEVVGLASSVSEALSVLRNRVEIDCAVLDVNLAGEMVFPVADALSEAQIPFIFLTGHSDNHLPARYHGLPVIQKPYLAADLLDDIRSQLAGS